MFQNTQAWIEEKLSSHVEFKLSVVENQLHDLIAKAKLVYKARLVICFPTNKKITTTLDHLGKKNKSPKLVIHNSHR